MCDWSVPGGWLDCGARATCVTSASVTQMTRTRAHLVSGRTSCLLLGQPFNLDLLEETSPSSLSPFMRDPLHLQCGHP